MFYTFINIYMNICIYTIIHIQSYTCTYITISVVAKPWMLGCHAATNVSFEKWLDKTYISCVQV